MPFTGRYLGYCNHHKKDVTPEEWFHKCSIRGCYHLLREKGGQKVYKPKFKKNNRLRRIR